MAQSVNRPLGEYIFKLCLLETVKCRVQNDYDGMVWIEALMRVMVERWQELNKK